MSRKHLVSQGGDSSLSLHDLSSGFDANGLIRKVVSTHFYGAQHDRSLNCITELKFQNHDKEFEEVNMILSINQALEKYGVKHGN